MLKAECKKNVVDFLSEIWQTITKNRSRSLLTAFGVFWGMLMLMVLIGLGNALTTGIYSNVDGFAMNSCIFGTGVTSKPYKGFRSGRSWDIQLADLDAIMQEVDGVECVSPQVFQGNATVSHGDKHESYRIAGVAPEYTRVLKVELLYGRFINNIDIQEKRKVCVIGNEVYKVLFPEGGNPVGERLMCGNIQYTVIGVRAANGNSIYIGGDPDKMLLAPLSTVQQICNFGDKVHILMAVAKQDIPASDMDKQIKTVLKERHQIAPDDDKAIFGFNAEEELKALSYLRLGLSALIWLIGLGTLISGAVGVSNIMLVTVRERTKEIGIRRAIGASPWVIARQIIAESTVLTTLAGIVGIMAGVGIVRVVGNILEHSDNFMKNPEVSFSAAIACLIIIVIIGILAGLLPALRALKIKPIEALSEE